MDLAQNLLALRWQGRYRHGCGEDNGFGAASLHQKSACAGDHSGRDSRNKAGFALAPVLANPPQIHEVGLLLMRVNPDPLAWG
ncbi:hypothetical protein BN948_03070 [Hydrogenophaga intermedia]|uniref:Uncharacterized protein n=1 Tax=Hydrogenophaga intermedia TaxID=65786 RepID=A0A1L1PTI9_HYDIT|nr:hypothetical protein Q5W_19400 [Hydrogenophaga sp. PBC]CDN88635.1 hypothetical protein BN948_03070 [Hydrogenophaga intermedia]